MLSTLILLASITFVSMMSPGPDMFLIIKNSQAKTPWPAVSCVLGICCGLAVHVALSILGIAAVINTSTAIYSIIKLLGAAYLIYIGIKSILSSDSNPMSQQSWSETSNNSVVAFQNGFFCNLLNPKVTIFILAVFSQVIDPSFLVWHKLFCGIFIIIEAFVVWNLFVLLVRTSLVLAFLQRFQLVIDRIVGVALIMFGATLALSD